ncbi:hypothetical protein L3Q82_012809 [Scortum barcoo]|uniref:Uncharacterized protein n=1 Tax=Scortum barcoo TaxID=214431 RepID=A0ACB8W417_9TELE|nr:hypothetical protein L3Q82_012809 [Scortum barcoo]
MRDLQQYVLDTQEKSRAVNRSPPGGELDQVAGEARQPKNPLMDSSHEESCQAEEGGVLGLSGPGPPEAAEGYLEAMRAVASVVAEEKTR